MNWKNIGMRAMWTFVQAFTGGVAATPIVEAITNTDLGSIGALLIGGFAAGIGAVLSFVKTVAQEQLEATALERAVALLSQPTGE